VPHCCVVISFSVLIALQIDSVLMTCVGKTALGALGDADSIAEINSPDTIASHSSNQGREDESELLDLSRDDEVSFLLHIKLVASFVVHRNCYNKQPCMLTC
jgi:hypothetical protein